MKYVIFLPRIPLLVSVLAIGIVNARSVTLDELRADTALTPERFASHFADFEFQLREKVQKPDVFLAAKNGDCDDYAILAAELLARRGYTPKLVVVFMAKDIHVVCYIAETKSYLDFNARKSQQLTVPSGSELGEIADAVAKSFKSNWHCVSEFTFKNGTRRIVQVDFPRAKQNVPVATAEVKKESVAATAN